MPVSPQGRTFYVEVLLSKRNGHATAHAPEHTWKYKDVRTAGERHERHQSEMNENKHLAHEHLLIVLFHTFVLHLKFLGAKV